jgi:hypothetical protein
MTLTILINIRPMIFFQLSPIYWPVERERIEFGPLVVEGLDTETSGDDVTVRDFRISKMVGKVNSLLRSPDLAAVA